MVYHHFLHQHDNFERISYYYYQTQSYVNTHRIHGAAIYGNMDPINKNPLYVSINIPAPWIRHGICAKVGLYTHMGMMLINPLI